MYRDGFYYLFPAVTYSPSFHQYHQRKKLNYRVRNGNGCFILTIPTGNLYIYQSTTNFTLFQTMII